MKIGQEVNYFGKKAIIIDLDRTHALIQFESGLQLCTPQNTFKTNN